MNFTDEEKIHAHISCVLKQEREELEHEYKLFLELLGEFPYGKEINIDNEPSFSCLDFLEKYYNTTFNIVNKAHSGLWHDLYIVVGSKEKRIEDLEKKIERIRNAN